MRDVLKEMLERHEGKKDRPYRDSVGILTIGIGHNMEARPLPQPYADCLKVNGRLSDTMIYELLDMDVAIALSSCHRVFPSFDTFSKNRQDALTDFMFNVGEKTARKFTQTIRYINNMEWSKAAEEILNSKWAEQVGQRAVELSQLIKEG